MAFVIRVFKPANHRCSCTGQLGQSLLSETRTLTEFADLARHRVVRLSFGQPGHSLRTPIVIAAVNDFDTSVARLCLLVFFIMELAREALFTDH